MDVKEFPGWIEDQRVKCLNIICEASSLHVCMPFHENEGETSRVLLQKYFLICFFVFLFEIFQYRDMFLDPKMGF